MKPIPIGDQETVISFAPPSVSNIAEVYTCMPGVMNKLRSQAEKRPDCVRITKDLGNAVFADVSRACIKIYPPHVPTEAERARAAANLARGRRMKNDTA